MKNKEQLAEEYADEQNLAWINDYYGFIAGYNSAEEKIKNRLEELKLQLQVERQREGNRVLNILKIPYLEVKIEELEQLLNSM